MSSSQFFAGSDLVVYRDRLKRRVRFWMGKGVRQKVDSSDLIQETLLFTISRLSTLVGRPKHQVYGWMLRVLRNRLMTVVTNLENARETALDHVPEPVANQSKILDQMVLDDLRSVCDTELAKRPAIEQAVFRQIYLEGATHEEIAERLKKSPAAIRAAQHRLLNHLRTRLRKGIR